MGNGPDISRVASLIGDPARANMLAALIGGMALTATELANEAGVSPQTASAHLSKLTDGGLLTATKQGRHRYFSLADPQTAELLESMMSFAADRHMRTRPGPRDPEMRQARICYDHLAGDMAIAMIDSLVERNVVLSADAGFAAGPEAERFFGNAGIDLESLRGNRRPLCRACMDWSARRPHLAGALGASILDLILEKRWARRIGGGRTIRFSPEGKRVFSSLFVA